MIFYLKWKIADYLSKLQGSLKKANSSQLKTYFDKVGAVFYSDFLNTRDVSKKINLENATYLLMPCMDSEDINLEFVLQIFAEQNIELKYLI